MHEFDLLIGVITLARGRVDLTTTRYLTSRRLPAFLHYRYWSSGRSAFFSVSTIRRFAAVQSYFFLRCACHSIPPTQKPGNTRP